jgi:hypothetical protein
VVSFTPRTPHPREKRVGYPNLRNKHTFFSQMFTKTKLLMRKISEKIRIVIYRIQLRKKHKNMSKKTLIILTYKATSVILVRLPLSLTLYKNSVCFDRHQCCKTEHLHFLDEAEIWKLTNEKNEKGWRQQTCKESY